MKAAIFDMDGVVVDDMRLHFKSWQMMLGNHGKEVEQDEFLKKFSGMSAPDTIQKIFPDMEWKKVMELATEKRRIYEDLLKSDLQPVEGLKEFLEELKEHGFRIGLATSATGKEMNFVLEKTGLKSYFEVQNDASKFEHRKPDPEPYRKTAKELGVPPEKCVVFEDAIMGILSARRAGMKVVGVATTLEPEYLGADIVISDFTEISADRVEELVK